MPLKTLPLPSSDRAFARVVKKIANSTDSVAEFVGRLRPLYPDVGLSRRMLSGEPAMFYVYRDGNYFGRRRSRRTTSEAGKSP